MSDLIYNQTNTLISIYETKLLSVDFFERMVLAMDAENAFACLNDSPYGDFIDENIEVYNFETVLEAELQRMYRQLYRIAPKKELIDFFTLKHDYHNLKVLVKQFFTKQDFSSMLVPVGCYSLQELQNLVFEKKSSVISSSMVECVQSVFEYLDFYQEIQNIDIIFDAFYWQQLQLIATSIDNEYLQKMLDGQINIYNISTVLRSYMMQRGHGFISSVLIENASIPAKELIQAIDKSLDAFIEYLQSTPYKDLINASYDELLETHTLTKFDLLRDNFIINFLQQNKLEPFGAMTLLRYIFIKEIEIKNLRLVLICKINHVGEAVIRERMRDIYV